MCIRDRTYPEPDSVHGENDFSLEDIPMGLKIARRRKLEEEAMLVNIILMLKISVIFSAVQKGNVSILTCLIISQRKCHDVNLKEVADEHYI